MKLTVVATGVFCLPHDQILKPGTALLDGKQETANGPRELFRFLSITFSFFISDTLDQLHIEQDLFPVYTQTVLKKNAIWRDAFVICIFPTSLSYCFHY